MLNLDELTEGIRDNGVFENMEGWWMWVESKLVLQLGDPNFDFTTDLNFGSFSVKIIKCNNAWEDLKLYAIS